ncbi:MAG TPA: hypothetical protein EYM65_09465 [Dehalococcoidia bacterium]|nr:hypothetical protein [Dehalococcoidia bacterium]
MDAAQVVEALVSLRISVRAKGDKLLLAPGSKVPQELVPDLQRCKLEILQLVTGPPPSFNYATAHVLAWAAHAAETAITLLEPVHFLETPLRPYTTAEVGRYCRDRLRCLAMARSNKVTGGWGRFTPEWWNDMEDQSIQALTALKATIDETDIRADESP